MHLTCAPVGFDLRGRRAARGRIVGRFSVPQPPFADVTGTWVMRQKESRRG
jgi:hypothetical protein